MASKYNKDEILAAYSESKSSAKYSLPERFAVGLMKPSENLVNTPENIAAFIKNIKNPNSTSAASSILPELPKATAAPEVAADITGRLLGEVGVGSLLGILTGGAGLAGKSSKRHNLRTR